MNCKECKKEIVSVVKSEPNRHACSPNSINWEAKKEEDKYYDYYCSKECQKKHQDLNYAYWAELDENASDGECFISEGWENGYRIGKCKITGARVRVMPLQPSNNSGQPKECIEHFVLREKYRNLLLTIRGGK